MINTLYLTRNGLLEPLGQSQVLGYLRGLARDYRIVLITREKDEDWANADAVADMRAECAALGIDWRPKPFQPRPRYLGPARDILAMIWDVLCAVRQDGVRLVHARSYIPAVVAWVAWRLTGTPFIFDMRALWPEELITAGRLRRGSWLHETIKWAERVCLRDAAASVSLTYAALDHLRDCEPAALAGKAVVVIPTCADLARFVPAAIPTSHQLGGRVHGCIGSILSGWFRADWLAAWFAGVAKNDLEARFEIITRDDPRTVRTAIDPEGTLGDRLAVLSRAPRDMPQAIRGHDVSVMFFTGGLSKLGSAPTRLAEVLGTGIPVIANAGVGDVARILRKHRIGVLLKGPEPENVMRAMRDFDELRADPDLPARCRKVAETLFSLETGISAYRDLYHNAINSSASAVGRGVRDEPETIL